MHWSRWLKRLTVHVAVFALLLKATVPMLASAAAHAQGVPVAEVCDVYGVAVVAQADHAEHLQHHHAAAHGHSPDPGKHHHSVAHGSDHCALTALAALAPPEAPDAPWTDATLARVGGGARLDARCERPMGGAPETRPSCCRLIGKSLAR